MRSGPKRFSWIGFQSCKTWEPKNSGPKAEQNGSDAIHFDVAAKQSMISSRLGSRQLTGQAQIVEKEKKHYQGLPEDLTPIAGKVGASAAEK